MSAWPKKTNWLAWIVGIVLLLVGFGIGYAIISGAVGQLGGGYGKQLNEASND